MEICVKLLPLLRQQQEVVMISVFPTTMPFSPFSDLAFEYHSALLREVDAVSTLCGHDLFCPLMCSLVSCIFQILRARFSAKST